jgi:hypothetical protein
MRKPLVALLAIGALAVPAATAGAAAKPKLPQPRSTAIKPNVGLGNMRLEQKMRPRPNGWRDPLKCVRLSGLRGCVWATRRDAVPPQGQMGIRGPFVMVMGRKRVSGFIIGSGATDVDARPLRRWKTPEGIGFTSTLDQFTQAYPTAQVNPSTGSYKLLADGNITIFVFANNVLSSIEMYTCEEYRDC